MSQQSVERGTQPLYYYALVQVPFYEYLPALGTVLALILGFARKLFLSKTDAIHESPFEKQVLPEPETLEGLEGTVLVLEDDAADQEDNPVLPSALTPEDINLTDTSDLQDTYDESHSDTQNLETTPPKKRPNLAFQTPFHRPTPLNTEIASDLPILALLLFWSFMSLLAFSIAGERMPWLTTHITMPMILTASFALGYLVEKN